MRLTGCVCYCGFAFCKYSGHKCVFCSCYRTFIKEGLITLKAEAGITATVEDITSNAKNLKFSEIEAASLPRVLADVDAAVINGNYAIPAGLSASKDGLYVEGSSSPYVNVIAVKAGNENSEQIKALVKALQSEKVQKYVSEKYPDGEVVTVF